MPQKKNPDVFELARGKSGTLIGLLGGLLAALKGLPSAYDKDLQEDKVPVFAAYDTLEALLPVLAEALRELTVHPERMQAGIDSEMLATDLADYLVERGVPFREAHALVGQVLRIAISKGISLARLPLQDYRSVDQAFDFDLFTVFDPQRSIARRLASGGTALPAVLAQIVQAKSALDNS
jgi:argininosuccinate lyase